MSSDRKIRVAIVGLGFGAEFIPIYQAHPNAEMYAICRRNQARARRLSAIASASSRATPTTTSCSTIPNVDAVHINSPDPRSRAAGLAALKAGKHVACTVPMATTVDECQADRRARSAKAARST